MTLLRQDYNGVYNNNVEFIIYDILGVSFTYEIKNI